MKISQPEIRSEEEALTRLEAARLEHQGVQEPTPSRQTLANYSVEWFERRKQWLAPSAVDMYRTILRQKILPQVGDIYCDVFERRDFENWVTWCERQTFRGEPYSEDTLKSWRRVFTPLLKDMAADMGRPDPTLRVRMARSTRRRVRECRALTVEQLRALLEAIQEDAPSRYAEVLTLAYTGMRSGELWALHCEDIEEINTRGIHIHRSVSSETVRDETKTGWERHAYAPPLVIEAIQEHRQEMERRAHRGLSSGLLFPSNAGTPRTSGSLKKTLGRACDIAGIEQNVTHQVLRRTYNTLLKQAGVDSLVVRSQLGHSSDQMTRHYFEGHLEAKQHAFEAVLGSGALH